MVLNVLSGSMVTKVSKNGNDPCCVGIHSKLDVRVLAVDVLS